MDSKEVAKKYFDLSNDSNFSEIAKLFTDTTVYTSQNTGEYIGADDIITMQKAFHGKFIKLNWTVNSINEINRSVYLFDYSFKGVKKDGDEMTSNGLEYITVKNKKIERVEIINK